MTEGRRRADSKAQEDRDFSIYCTFYCTLLLRELDEPRASGPFNKHHYEPLLSLIKPLSSFEDHSNSLLELNTSLTLS